MINIYDFDKTIYYKDSSVEFFKYILKKNKKVLKIIPKLFWYLFLYIINLKEKTDVKEVFFGFLKYIPNVDKEVEDFWKINKSLIKEFYIKNKKSSDIIISASPEFLLEGISKELGVSLIATKMDKNTGKIDGKNCYAEEKIKRLFSEKKINSCLETYSDSLSDAPMASISKKAYIVKEDKLIEWELYKPSIIKKFANMFFARDFMFFVVIGLINTFDVIWMSLVYSLFMNDVLGFVCGWTTSLCVAYTLNSLLNFKEKLSLKKLIAFALSNIPNFIIQNLTAYIVLDLLLWNKLLSYFIAAIIGVPVTFICIKLFVFNKKEGKAK